MSYEKLFMKCGCPSREADIRITGYLVRPDSLTRFDEVKHWDGSVMRIIAECEATISALQDYRKALAARYGALATMPSHGKLSLERDRGYNGITYYVRQFTVYEDGTENQDNCERFPGKERHQAIARFEELKKLHPDYEAVKDIEKRQWEK